MFSHQEMQIKTIVRYHYTPIRTAKIKKIAHTQCWRGCGTNRNFIYYWEGSDENETISSKDSLAAS